MGHGFCSSVAVLMVLPLFLFNTKSFLPLTYRLICIQNTSLRSLSIVTATMPRISLAKSAGCGRPTFDCPTASRPSHDQFLCVCHLMWYLNFEIIVLIKFLRHLLGITKLDKEKNQCIRGKNGSTEYSKGNKTVPGKVATTRT